MTIKALSSQGTTTSDITRLLGVTEGAVRYHLERMRASAVDGRSRQPFRAQAVVEAIETWRTVQEDGPINLAALHNWLGREHDYAGSLRSVQRYRARAYPAPAVLARRRVEMPAGAQAQVDWADFPRVMVGGSVRELLTLHMVLSFSRKAAVVWAESKDLLAWIGCHTACFQRRGGV